jgi:hypothetical protein
VTAKAFRKIALSLPEAVEAAHMGHPDFRVGRKIFATLGPEEDWGMVKLTADQQADLVGDETGPYRSASGAWGLWGATIVRLRDADQRTVRQAIIDAWRNTAPKRLVKHYDQE